MPLFRELVRDLVKSTYRATPRKREVLHALRAVYRPSFYRRLRFDGPFEVAIDQETSFRLVQSTLHYGIETEFFWNGFHDAWESASLALWTRLARHARVVLDIGACEGVYALSAKAINPGARVFAFEPLPSAFDLLSRNVVANGFDIALQRLALSDKDGSAEFFVGSETFSTEGSLAARRGQKPNSLSVETRRLDTLIRTQALPRIDLMKIDVEHFEAEVLRGMGGFLDRFRPIMIVELLTDEVAHDVESLVRGLDYLFFDINDDGRNGRVKGHRQADHLRKSSCLNFLLIPKGVAERCGILQSCVASFESGMR